MSSIRPNNQAGIHVHLLLFGATRGIRTRHCPDPKSGASYQLGYRGTYAVERIRTSNRPQSECGAYTSSATTAACGAGIEPALSASKADVLPLDDPQVGVEGLEPPTLGL